MFLLFPILLICFVEGSAQYIENCPKSKDCTWKLPQFVTQNLKCISNYQCPPGFLCCPDCHYEHYVCKPTIWAQEEDLCPKDLKFCNRPLPYERTNHYKCTSHIQCHKTDRCCSDSCYTHKVCKTIHQHVEKPESVCPMSIRRELCPNTNRTLIKYSCRHDGDCFSGYICCYDNCYDHMVCKIPKDAFSYRSIYKPSNYTPPTSFERQYKCPEVNMKCDKPYSLRLAKKFICFKNEDCKIGQLCCKDSCVKEFKICKDIFSLPPKLSLGEAPLEKESVKLFDNSTISTTSEYEKETIIDLKEKRKKLPTKVITEENFGTNKENEFYFISDLQIDEGSGSGWEFQDEEE